MRETQNTNAICDDRTSIIGIEQTAARCDEAAVSRSVKSVKLPPLTLGSLRKCARGDVVDTCDSDQLRVLEVGSLLIEYRGAAGRQFVLDFLFPGQVITSSTRLDDNEAATINIVAAEDSSFRAWTRADVERSGGIHSWAALTRDLEERALARTSRRFLSMLTRDALNRYIGLNDEFPADWRRLPQHLVASYLGITPQYLCQLRRRANSRLS